MTLAYVNSFRISPGYLAAVDGDRVGYDHRVGGDAGAQLVIAGVHSAGRIERENATEACQPGCIGRGVNRPFTPGVVLAAGEGWIGEGDVETINAQSRLLKIAVGRFRRAPRTMNATFSPRCAC